MKNLLRKPWWLYCTFVALSIIVYSCKKDHSKEKLGNSIQKESGYDHDGVMVLGEQLDNPYSIGNMTAAKDNLVNLGLIEDFEIEANKLYVRFLPEDTLQANALESDSTLELFDHPLDYEILEYGAYYHDPSINDTMPTYQYTVVDPGYALPGISYEVLEELFLMDPDLAEVVDYPIDTAAWELLEDEALTITGNLEEETEGGYKSTQKRSKWAPSGKIQVEEQSHQLVGTWPNQTWSPVSHGWVPLRKCKVRARQWFRWKSTYTSATDGTFSLPKKFKGSANYSLEFENTRYKVTDALGIVPNYNGPKRRGDWNLNISFNSNSKSWYRATCLNAIYHFREQAQLHDIKAYSTAYKIKVRAAFSSDYSSNTIGTFRHYLTGGSKLFGSDVRINTKFDDGPKYTDDIYDVVMHELGHISHALKSPLNWIFVSGIARESWAIAVEYYFMLPYYPNYVRDMDDQDRNTIVAGSNRAWKYTPFFIDLADTTNQRAINLGNTLFAQDNVQGYSLHQMQDALDFRTSLQGICDHLENNYGNSTEQHLDDLMEFYQDIIDNH